MTVQEEIAVPQYRIKPTATSMDLPAADFMCEECGKVVGMVRWRFDVRDISVAQALSRCPELTAIIQQHEKECPKKA